MNPSKKFIDLCHSSESCRLKSYQDKGGVWTIGWGHTGVEVKEGVVITQDRADQFFFNDCAYFVNWLNRQNFNINQNQFDALLDLIYNCGPGGLVNDFDFYKLVRTDPNNPAIGDYFKKHIRDRAGNIEPGLVIRRGKDIKLYFS